MAIVALFVDGVFCDTSHDIPGAEPDAYAQRWYRNLYEGAVEQFVLFCNSPNTVAVGEWLRGMGIKFSTLISTQDVDNPQRIDVIMKFAGAQHSKIVLFIGSSFYDCNQFAERGVPSLRYLPPNQNAKWEPDQRSAWVKAIEKQEA